MNRSFKVVFSKARDTFMVVNELTSSVQAKGTKTVIGNGRGQSSPALPAPANRLGLRFPRLA